MARTKSEDVIARGADVPLALGSAGPRDALVDPRPEDIIPDNEEKGYHVGMVRQPAEPVLHRSGDVTFESIGESDESKFDGAPSLKDLKEAHNRREASDPRYEGVAVVTDQPLEDEPVRPRATRRAGPSVDDEPSRGEADKLEAKSAAVARRQTAEDTADK